MDVAGIEYLARKLASSSGWRVRTGAWDGSKFRPSDAPGVALTAENAAGQLAAGSFVYALHRDGEAPIIIGPTTIPAVPRMASGIFTEPLGGPQVSWVAFPPWAFARGAGAPPIVVTVTLLSGAGAHTWDAPRITSIGDTGFNLFTRNGAGAQFAWIAHQRSA